MFSYSYYEELKAITGRIEVPLLIQPGEVYLLLVIT